MQLFTSRYANRALDTYPGTKVGITRSVPQWKLHYHYFWLKVLGADKEMMGLDHADFEKVYRAKLDRLGVAEVLRLIAERAGVTVEDDSVVVLLCYEDLRVDVFCHRRILAAWLQEQAGIDVPELDNDPNFPAKAKTPRSMKTAGMPQATQLSLAF